MARWKARRFWQSFGWRRWEYDDCEEVWGSANERRGKPTEISVEDCSVWWALRSSYTWIFNFYWRGKMTGPANNHTGAGYHRWKDLGNKWRSMVWFTSWIQNYFCCQTMCTTSLILSHPQHRKDNKHNSSCQAILPSSRPVMRQFIAQFQTYFN